jgi:hypothetical protein
MQAMTKWSGPSGEGLVSCKNLFPMLLKFSIKYVQNSGPVPLDRESKYPNISKTVEIPT